MPIAVVTGAGRGIGRAVAVRLAAEGYELVCVDADEAGARSTAEQVGGRAVAADVRDEAAAAEVAAGLGRCDVLVNNAGTWRFARLADTSVAEAADVLGVHVIGTLVWLKALVPLMTRAGGGSVVNLTSVSCRAAATGVGMYPPAKAAVITLTELAALEYAHAGVRVNAVGPGMVVTEGTRSAFGETPERQAERGALVPLGRLGKPEDVAGAVTFLCSPDAAYITGQVLWVDGGFTVGANEYFRAAARPRQ